MRIFKKAIQRRLSALLGVEVTFEALSVSLIDGSIDMRGVVVNSTDGNAPVLTIERARAHIMITRILHKEVIVRALAIERPMLSIRRQNDGTTNLPSVWPGPRSA